MAECNPPEPPPLLREPPHKLLTPADRNAAEAERWERAQRIFWGDSYRYDLIPGGCGCLVLVGIAIACASLGLIDPPADPLPVLTALAEVASRRVPR